MGERAAGGSLCRCGARTSGGGQRCGCGSQRPTRVVHFPSAFCFLPCPCSLLPPPFFLLPSPFSLIPYPFSLPPTPFPYPEYCSTERATNNCSIQDCKNKNANIFCADRCVVFLFVVRRWIVVKQSVWKWLCGQLIALKDLMWKEVSRKELCWNDRRGTIVYDNFVRKELKWHLVVENKLGGTIGVGKHSLRRDFSWG